MDDEKRITDHQPLIDAARADAGREGARMVRLSLAELWRIMHKAPLVLRPQPGDGDAGPVTESPVR